MRLFEAADQYIKESDWKTIALLKICLLALGVLIGMQVPKEKRKIVFGIGGLVFLATYVPLITKFVKIIMQETYEE